MLLDDFTTIVLFSICVLEIAVQPVQMMAVNVMMSYEFGGHHETFSSEQGQLLWDE